MALKSTFVLSESRYWPKFLLSCLSFNAQRIMVSNESLIYQSKANLAKKALFRTITIICLCGHVWESRIRPISWSMIYLGLKCTFNSIVRFRTRVLISIANNSQARMERAILVPIQTRCKHFSNFSVFMINDFTKQNFDIYVSF